MKQAAVQKDTERKIPVKSSWSEAQLQVLLEINNAIITHLDRDSLFTTMFDTIARSLRKVLSFERCNINLYDPERDVFKAFALVGPTIAPFMEVPGSKGGQGRFLIHQRPFVTRDIRETPPNPVSQHVREAALKAGLRSGMGVPLIAKGKTIGTLNMTSKVVGQYSGEDGAFLFEVAKQISLALQNMTAYEEITQLKARLEQENVYLQEEIKTEHNFEEIVGQGAAMRKVLKAVETAAPTDVSVLISGETGTGKELVARAIHNLSRRKDKALVKVNCAALPAGLIESELFGHEKGAFTGALSRKPGRFELADGGTIFLDEIGDLPLELQAKLLRVLQEGEFERVGGAQTLRADVRVIAATNRDLEQAVREGKFRQDLFYRLNVFPVHLPPLRERKEDIPLLVRHFVLKHSVRLGKKIEAIPQRTMDALRAYPWPGNVREMENVIERAVILSQGPRLDFGDWLPRPGVAPSGARIRTLEEVEREHILEALEQTGWRVSGERGAARLLGLKRTTLESRMKRLGIRKNPDISSK